MAAQSRTEARVREDFRSGQPVLHLQTMLRNISFQYGVIPQVIPTGRFDEPTLEAVMVFQREFHPPVTGVVDAGTWNAIAAYYRRARAELAAPYPCVGFPFGALTIQPGDASVHLPVIQAMFQALSAVLDGIEPCAASGVHDSATVHNVRWLGTCDGCETGDVICRETWNYLSRLYRVFIGYGQTPNFTRQEVLAPAGGGG